MVGVIIKILSLLIDLSEFENINVDDLVPTDLAVWLGEDYELSST